MIEVDDFRTKPVQGFPSNLTPTPLKNPVPVIITAVPPARVPLEGDTKVTVGAACSAYPLDKIPFRVSVHTIKTMFIFNLIKVPYL